MREIREGNARLQALVDQSIAQAGAFPRESCVRHPEQFPAV
jgi:hypothetical protein